MPGCSPSTGLFHQTGPTMHDQTTAPGCCTDFGKGSSTHCLPFLHVSGVFLVNRPTYQEAALTLGVAIAAYGFAMTRLVEHKLEQSGKTEDIHALCARGFHWLFTFSRESGSDGSRGKVRAAAFDTQTGQTVPLLSLELREDISAHVPGPPIQ